MPDPLQLLCVSTQPPDLATSAFGPFVVQRCADLAEAGAQLRMQRFDALVVQFEGTDDEAALRHWSGLSSAVLDMALIVVVQEPSAPQVARWQQLGAQEVLPARGCTAERLALALVQGVGRKQLERAARRAHATDLATGLPNHAQLMEHMTHLLALREREPASMALLVLRLDGLATAEARHGPEAVNVLRRKAAVRLRSGLRASDVVAALGADRFAVLLAWIDDDADAERVAAKLGAALQRPFTVAGQPIALAVAAGVARSSAHGRDAEALLRAASGEATQREAQGRAGFANRVERGDEPAANDERGD
jgi:diguanylate cyclase (GGDEF)-like protein